MSNGTAADFNETTVEVNKKKTKISGVILIDKPKGMTSQQVVSKVKYLFKSPVHDSKKAGHTGTLDPMATGLLPICMGEATKFSHYQLDADKSYIAIINIGAKTDTGDAEGEVVATKPFPVLTQTLLDSIVGQFQGDIRQIPPMYSALKKDGKKLYEYARAGIEVERESRPITIKALSLTLTDKQSEIALEVTCTKGTYVRVLGEDIAEALGTYGHLTALRRTKVGYFDINNAIDLVKFEALTYEDRLLRLLPIDGCISDLPVLIVDERQCERLRLGQRLNVKTQMDKTLLNHMTIVNSNHGYYDVRLFNEEQLFLGLGKLEQDGRLQPKKMIKY